MCVCVCVCVGGGGGGMRVRALRFSIPFFVYSESISF